MSAEIYRGRNALILENILGANNELLPPESSIEEILQSILYDTPFTKTLVNPSNNEKLLLAIKNGTPFTETIVNPSRNEQILLAKINHTEYNETPQSYIELLLIEWLEQSLYFELTGVPPLIFHSNGQPLIDWTIYGASGGVGERTENLYDYSTIVNGYTYNANGQMILNPDETNRWRYSAVPLIEVEPGATYLRTYDLAPWGNIINFYDSNKNFLEQVSPGSGIPVTMPSNCKFVSFVFQTFNMDAKKYMFTKGSTAPSSYIPYGYKIAVTCGGETTNIYIDEPLTDGETITSIETGVSIPTVDGENTLTVDTTVQPEKMYIQYEPYTGGFYITTDNNILATNTDEPYILKEG